VSAAAIIPVWNGRPLLLKLFASLEKQTTPFDEILVVDNGSEDGAPDAAESRGARVIRLGRNTGFAHAVNRGIEACRTEHLAILNSDVELHPDWLASLIAAEAPFACGKILSASAPKILDGSFDLLCRGACPWRAGHGAHDHSPFTPQTIAMASFTAVLFQRQVFLSAGLLDETFESYLEDVDFGLRCMALGISGQFVPDALCTHFGSAALGRWSAPSVRSMARNQLFLIAKHFPRELCRRWWWPILVAQSLWGLVALRHGAGLAWVRGKWEGLLHFHQLPYTPNFGLVAALSQQESMIYELQKIQGMDLFWRVYFGLAGEKRHRQVYE
jgi:GT2 family glycosyltransferase